MAEKCDDCGQWTFRLNRDSVGPADNTAVIATHSGNGFWELFPGVGTVLPPSGAERLAIDTPLSAGGVPDPEAVAMLMNVQMPSDGAIVAHGTASFIATAGGSAARLVLSIDGVAVAGAAVTDLLINQRAVLAVHERRAVAAGARQVTWVLTCTAGAINVDVASTPALAHGAVSGIGTA